VGGVFDAGNFHNRSQKRKWGGGGVAGETFLSFEGFIVSRTPKGGGTPLDSTAGEIFVGGGGGGGGPGGLRGGEQIKPTPRWSFLFCFWLVAALVSVYAGALLGHFRAPGGGGGGRGFRHTKGGGPGWVRGDGKAPAGMFFRGGGGEKKPHRSPGIFLLGGPTENLDGKKKFRFFLFSCWFVGSREGVLSGGRVGLPHGAAALLMCPTGQLEFAEFPTIFSSVAHSSLVFFSPSFFFPPFLLVVSEKGQGGGIFWGWAHGCGGKSGGQSVCSFFGGGGAGFFGAFITRAGGAGPGKGGPNTAGEGGTSGLRTNPQEKRIFFPFRKGGNFSGWPKKKKSGLC